MNDIDLFNSNCQSVQNRIDAFRQTIEATNNPEILLDLGDEVNEIWIAIRSLNTFIVNSNYTTAIMHLRRRLLLIENLRGARFLALEGDPQE
jgi:hypothetical protein